MLFIYAHCTRPCFPVFVQLYLARWCVWSRTPHGINLRQCKRQYFMHEYVFKMYLFICSDPGHEIWEDVCSIGDGRWVVATMRNCFRKCTRHIIGQMAAAAHYHCTHTKEQETFVVAVVVDVALTFDTSTEAPTTTRIASTDTFRLTCEN